MVKDTCDLCGQVRDVYPACRHCKRILCRECDDDDGRGGHYEACEGLRATLKQYAYNHERNEAQIQRGMAELEETTKMLRAAIAVKAPDLSAKVESREMTIEQAIREIRKRHAERNGP